MRGLDVLRLGKPWRSVPGCVEKCWQEEKLCGQQDEDQRGHVFCPSRRCPEGWQLHIQGYARRKFRWGHWRWGRQQEEICATHHECNATFYVMLFIKTWGRFACLGELCPYRRDHSSNYFGWFWSVRCTPLICLWIYQRLVKHVSPRGQSFSTSQLCYPHRVRGNRSLQPSAISTSHFSQILVFCH